MRAGVGVTLRFFGLMVFGLAFPVATQAQAGVPPQCPRGEATERWTRCVGTWVDAAGGQAYAGEFMNGTFHGQGVLLFDGTSGYTGSFMNGRMHGEGVLTLADGQRYVGGFENGVMSGFGRLLGADGQEVFAGLFADNAPVTAVAGNPAPGPAVPPGAAPAPPVGVAAPPAVPMAPPAPAPAEALPAQVAGTLNWPPLPPRASTPIEGVYLTVRTWMSGSTDINVWFFSRNGRFSRSPRGGLSLAALASKPAATAEEGTYRVENGELILEWADGRAAWRQPYDGSELRIDGVFASRQTGFQRGWRLDGTYSGGASGGGGAVSGSTLVFRRDGTFSRSSAVSAATSGTRTETTVGGTSAANGTYQFDDFTLTLLENGVESRFTVLAYGARDQAGRPEAIFWEGIMVNRQADR